MADEKQKEHIGVVIVGHVDAGKSTTTGHLLVELGGISQRELEKLQKEAEVLNKASFAYAFALDKGKDSRNRGITIDCATKQFFTEKYHYTVIDAPGHHDFVKNMISGASQADVAVLLVPADKGGFETSIQKGNHKKDEVQGQTRQHARLCNLLGIDQIIVAINKMDAVGYSEARFKEIKTEVKKILAKIGFNMKKIPFIPMSGYKGENLTKVSAEMPWYKGFEVTVKKKKVKGHTLTDALNDVVRAPKRDKKSPACVPISGVYKIKGSGDVVTGRVERGNFFVGDGIVFHPSGAKGRIFSIEMHHKSASKAVDGDNVGLNVKGLDRDLMPRPGDVACIDEPDAPREALSFKAEVYVQDHPGKLVAGSGTATGFTPSIHVRTAKAPCKMTAIHWKMGSKSTGGQKVSDSVTFLQAGDRAEVSWQPMKPICLTPVSECKGLGRIAVMNSNNLVMLGKVTEVKYKDA